jgi:hypothetical protein
MDGSDCSADLGTPTSSLQDLRRSIVGVFVTHTNALMPNDAPWVGLRIGWVLFQVLGAGFGANLYHRVVLERSGYFMTSAEPGRLKGSR